MIGNILRQRYQIVKELGAGGFGETYLAEDLDIPVTPKQICVVKRLKPTEIDRDISRLFEQEAKILYQLGQNHDQIPKLYAYFQEGKEFYLIQELIDGYDLTQEISPGKKLSEGDVIQLLQDVLEILVYVHDNKFIHRDIKPANIMRRKDGKLVLIDFGIVKQINTTIALKSGFTTRTIGIGTAGYMPLEQAMGKPKFSSDIYALGMTAIQALIDLSPRLLPEDDDGEIIWIDQVEVSNKLENFITKMVRCDWRQRYKNAKEALDELNQIFGVGQEQNIYPAQLTELSGICVNQNDEPPNLQKPEEVIESYKEAIAIQPDQHETCYHRGKALKALQRYEEAIESYNQAIAIKSDYYEAWYNRGLTLRTLRRYEEAIESYDKAIAIQPDQHEAWYHRGDALRNLQRYEESIESYDKAIAIKSDYYEAWYNRGIALRTLQRYEESIESYDKAIAIQPNDALAWHKKGNTLRTLKRHEEAILSYDKAIDIQPNKHEFWYNRGDCLRNLQRYKEAIKSYDKAIAIQPKNYTSWYKRGLVLENLQRDKEALKSYQKAISIKPDFQKAINNHNKLLKRLGN
ncbi:tetratricopeptide repeat protein [Anabaena lutea]|uniref:Tetratricopeptide repeat protein n=1 Tax=Anabaena lutea FACHB-196 TaxID=2692881 RepID=A0ABR8FDS9_9NOST|nr:serine/threonine-protein kinase [Anabaena lutea]MBD2567887.1 tetratricopeptide repeat protein [Anabaena lutea FACHB-196]